MKRILGNSNYREKLECHRTEANGFHGETRHRHMDNGLMESPNVSKRSVAMADRKVARALVASSTSAGGLSIETSSGKFSHHHPLHVMGISFHLSNKETSCFLAVSLVHRG